MKALYLLILSAIFDCSVAYTIVERPANVDEKQFTYNRIPSGEVQSRPPVGFWFQQRPYNLPKTEPQALFELYYLIQVITIYRRHHPRAHRSHLDALVEELQDDGFQQKIRQALQGIKEIDVTQAYADLNLQDYAPFVNDRRQLIPAIHRTLNEIHLGQIKDKDLRWTLERLKEESTALTLKMARKEAEVLKELIESSRKVEKVWTVSDILAAVFGKQDEDTMQDFQQKYEVVDDGKPIDDGKVEEFWVVFEDGKKEEPTTKTPPSTTSAEPEPEPFQFIDDNYEQYEAKQESEVEAKEEEVEQTSEISTESKEVEDTIVEEETIKESLEQDSAPKEEVEAVKEEEAAVESLEESNSPVEEEVVVESTDDLDGEQRIESDGFEFKEENYERSENEEQDYERTVPDEDDQGIVEEEVVAEEELPDPVPEELQTLDTFVEGVEDPAPVYTEETKEELPGLVDSVKSEEEPEPEYTEELKEELQSLDSSLAVEVSDPKYTDQEEDGSEEPEEQSKPDLTQELEHEILAEPAAAKASPDSITYPVDPQWIEDSVRPLGSSAATGLDSEAPYETEELPAPSGTQSVPLWISKGYAAEYEGREAVEADAQPEEVQEVDTDDLESRTEPSETVEIDQETLRYIAFEILKVVSLLEDNAGFTGLREQITSEDVDRLIEQLSVEQFVSLIDEQGINRVEMINALERLVVDKEMESSSEIIAVLEQWKQGEEAGTNEDEVDGNMLEEGEAQDVESLVDETENVVEESDGNALEEDEPKQWKEGEEAGTDEDEVDGRMLEEGEDAAQVAESLVDETENVVEESDDNTLEEVEPEERIDPEDAEQIDDGYFSEKYGKAVDDEVEGRMLDEDEEEVQEEQVENSEEALEEVQLESDSVQELKPNDLEADSDLEQVDDGYFAENYGKSDDEAEVLEDESELVVATSDEAQDAEQLVDELEGELNVDAELQVDDSNTVDELAVESGSIQELKSGDLVEDAELLKDLPSLQEDANDLSEGISQVENLEESRISTVDEASNKLQSLSEEVLVVEPFPDQILDEAQPMEIALEDQLDKLEPFPDQIMNETQRLDESDSAVDNPKIVPVSNRPFPATYNVGSEPLEMARAGTNESTLADDERREEILEDLHPEP